MRKKSFERSIPGGLILPAMFFFLIPAAGAVSSPGASISLVQGQVQWKETPRSEWKDAQKGQSLPEGAQILTGAGAICEVRIGEGGNAVRINPESHASLASLDPVRVELQSGRLYALARDLKPGSSFEVATPTAVASARATAWGQSLGFVDVFEDKVSVRGTAGGEEIIVSEGTGVDVSEDGRLGRPHALDDKVLGEWKEAGASLKGPAAQGRTGKELSGAWPKEYYFQRANYEQATARFLRDHLFGRQEFIRLGLVDPVTGVFTNPRFLRGLSGQLPSTDRRERPVVYLAMHMDPSEVAEFLETGVRPSALPRKGAYLEAAPGAVTSFFNLQSFQVDKPRFVPVIVQVLREAVADPAQAGADSWAVFTDIPPASITDLYLLQVLSREEGNFETFVVLCGEGEVALYSPDHRLQSILTTDQGVPNSNNVAFIGADGKVRADRLSNLIRKSLEHGGDLFGVSQGSIEITTARGDRYLLSPDGSNVAVLSPTAMLPPTFACSDIQVSGEWSLERRATGRPPIRLIESDPSARQISGSLSAEDAMFSHKGDQ